MIFPTNQQEYLQFCRDVMPVFLEYVRTHQTPIEQVELAVVKEGIVSFPATQVLGGVQKTVRVPLSVITANIDDAEELCRQMAEYARSQGESLQALIIQVNSIMAQVEAQGNTAEAQGLAAQAARQDVEAWYNPFRSAAESWYSGKVSEVASWFSQVSSNWTTWFSERQSQWTSWFNEKSSDWTSWYDARREEWTTWFNGVTSDWNTWFAARKLEWTNWFNGVTSDWSTWYAATMDDWNTWFAARKQQWNEWFAAKGTEWSEWFTSVRSIVESWATKEQERQTAEEIRQEIMAHPPIPSERGYWMFWDMTVTPHAYVESGYSSRGTMDWPEFFWDYSCMGIGVVTTRDYSRFFIDEQGRYGMLM